MSFCATQVLWGEENWIKLTLEMTKAIRTEKARSFIRSLCVQLLLFRATRYPTGLQKLVSLNASLVSTQ